MFTSKFARQCTLIAGLGLAVVSLSVYGQENGKPGRKYKAPPPAARIEVTVLRASDGKPIEDAAVIFHPIEGDKDKGSLELKTNEDGKTLIDVIPIGDTVRLQIIARGYQTYGGDYKVDKDQMTMEVRMNRPGQQYSIYQNGDNKNSDKPKDDKNQPQK
jgi:hypothetical protein